MTSCERYLYAVSASDKGSGTLVTVFAPDAGATAGLAPVRSVELSGTPHRAVLLDLVCATADCGSHASVDSRLLVDDATFFRIAERRRDGAT